MPTGEADAPPPGDALSHNPSDEKGPEKWERVKSQPDPAQPDARDFPFLAAFYSGPYPPPAMIREYEAIAPGLGTKIIDSIVSQGKHRQKLETSVVEGGLAHEKLGVLAGGAVAITSIVTGGVVAAVGFPVAGGTIATACVLSLVGVFVYGTDSRRKEREKKAAIQQEIAEETALKIPPQLEPPSAPA